MIKFEGTISEESPTLPSMFSVIELAVNEVLDTLNLWWQYMDKAGLEERGEIKEREETQDKDSFAILTTRLIQKLFHFFSFFFL